MLELVDELEHQAPAALQREIHTVSKQVRIALPHLLLFTRGLDTLQEQAVAQLGAWAVHPACLGRASSAHPGSRPR